MGDQNNEPISKKLLVLNLVLALLVVSMIFAIHDVTNQSTRTEAVIVEEEVTSPVFEKLKLSAKAAYVYDLNDNKVLYKKNEFVQLPLASITKLMTALTAAELVPGFAHVQIKKEFLNEEGDAGLLVDESWRLNDLIDFSLVVSSNDGVRSIASVIGSLEKKTDDYNLGRKEFIAKMNAKAQDLGLMQTYFVNESGLDMGEISGGYGSAIDVARLMQYILRNHPEIIEATKYRVLNINSLDATHTATNTNTSVDSIPGLIASKTGYTSLAGGNLVVAFDASIGHPIVVVVLGSTQEARFSDVSSLVEASLEYIRQ